MGHRPPRHHSAFVPMPPRPPRPPRKTDGIATGVEELIACARQEYVDGRMEAEDFEAALDHIFAGGRGNEEFPYLPMFPMSRMERLCR